MGRERQTREATRWPLGRAALVVSAAVLALVVHGDPAHADPASGPPAHATPASPQPTSASSASAQRAPLAWASASESPSPVPNDALSDRQAALLAHCGTGDLGLVHAAARVVARKIAGEAYLDTENLAFAQRVEGEPHVWPRAWVVSGRAIDHETALKQMDVWRASFRDVGERRCGVAVGFASDGSEVLAAIAVDALADLEPLPTHARVGQWLDVDAHLLVPAVNARVMILGPGGDPRRIPTSLDGARVRARFAPDRPGAFTVQLLAEVATGPRPVLEARVFADVAPPAAMPILVAPGEDARATAADATSQLASMVSALRDAEGLPRPQREPALDALAAAHAHAMMRARAVGHDVGDGEPTQRLQNAGIPAREVGENVAHAASTRLAHRALWQSPSHRANLMRADFTRAGYAAIEDTDASVWVVELFAR